MAEKRVIIDVRVIPRARRSEVAGIRATALLVRLKAPPVEGAANRELTGVLADLFGVPRSAVTIIGGESSRSKRVAIAGISTGDVDVVMRTAASRGRA